MRPVPPAQAPLAAHRARSVEVERISQAISRLEGRRAAAAERAGALQAEVSLAKGRLNAKPLVEAFLDKVQEDQNRRNVSTFETLLTLLSSEVLPWADPVRLELSTERNLPSLNIAVERPGGEREDVYEDQGGAMTNVISAGLRLIAVVKSRSSLFVALDEADCWISTDRVPSFYAVLEDAATRLGVQCFAISHHDVGAFGSGIRVSRIEGHPKDGVTITCPASPPDWDEGRRGLRSLRLVNVQGYEDATLHLSPGVNALTGPNNRGKSTLSRALRALFLGDVRDSLIRHGARSCTVEARVHGGMTLRYVRQRRTPVNVWSLHDAAGEVVVADGIRCETAGTGVPDWLTDAFGIAPVQDLDVHISHQKKPVFLLAESASKRASVLSVGQEADHARRMIEIHKDRNRKDSLAVRDGEREIDQLRRLAEHLRGAEDLARGVEGLRLRIAAIEDGARALAEAEGTLAALEAARRVAERSAARRAALATLPEPSVRDAIAARLAETAAAEGATGALVSALEAWRLAYDRAEVLDGLPEAAPAIADSDGVASLLGTLVGSAASAARARARAEILAGLPGDAPALSSPDAMIPLGVALKDARVALERARARAAALARLPEAPPAQSATAEAERAAADLARHAGLAAAALARRSELADEEARVRAELEEVLGSTGGTCPACGRPVEDAAMLVEGHDHG